MGRTTTSRGRDQRGESLIEMLITIVILGITVPAIMGAVLLATSVSSQNRREIQAQALLNTWAETIARENSDVTYKPCASPAYYETAPFAPPGVPVGFTASVLAITYWDGSAYSGACAVDRGTRRLQLRIAVGKGVYPAFNATQSIVLRRPCLAC